MGRLADGRDIRYTTYEPAHLLWVGLLVFCLKLGSRRQIRFETNTAAALENLCRLCGHRQEEVADPDSVNYYLTLLPAGELENLRDLMIQRLIRSKVLDNQRLDGALLVAVDATGQLSFGNQRHCEHCLSKKSGEGFIYYHPVLEAKLVTPSGLAFSIGTEFIHNPDPNPSKQDCELRAFIRLAEQIKKKYPQLRLCFLFDGLYANGTVFDICRKNGWTFIVTFKEGSLPALWRDYQMAKYQQRDNHAQQVIEPPGASSPLLSAGVAAWFLRVPLPRSRRGERSVLERRACPSSPVWRLSSRAGPPSQAESPVPAGCLSLAESWPPAGSPAGEAALLLLVSSG